MVSYGRAEVDRNPFNCSSLLTKFLGKLHGVLSGNFWRFPGTICDWAMRWRFDCTPPRGTLATTTNCAPKWWSAKHTLGFRRTCAATTRNRRIHRRASSACRLLHHLKCVFVARKGKNATAKSNILSINKCALTKPLIYLRDSFASWPAWHWRAIVGTIPKWIWSTSRDSVERSDRRWQGWQLRAKGCGQNQAPGSKSPRTRQSNGNSPPNNGWNWSSIDSKTLGCIVSHRNAVHIALSATQRPEAL